MAHSMPLPLIDWKSLQTLSDGDKAFEAELLQLFVEDTRSHLSKLAEAIARDDADQVRRLAHHLKGASANVGALGLSEAAGILETEARQANLNPAPALQQQMQLNFTEIERLIALQTWQN